MRVKIFGPPGSGKTETALRLMEEAFADGVAPNEIAFVTFTKSARLEALKRVARLGYTEKDVPYIKTIHALCFSEVVKSRESVLDAKRLGVFGEKISVSLKYVMDADEDIEVSEASKILNAWHVARACFATTGYTFAHNFDPHFALWLIETYEKYKQAQHLVDYTDFLTTYLLHGRPLNVKVAFVDEAQDLSLLQWRVVDKMFEQAEHVYCLGDDDQSVYGWAGAKAVDFLSWPSDKQEVLSQSWRLPRSVHETALRIVKQIKLRQEKEFAPTSEEGLVRYTHDLLDVIRSGESGLLLYRNHYLAKGLEEELQRRGISYAGRYSPLQRKNEIRAILTWERMLKGEPISGESLANALSYGPKRFEKLKRQCLESSEKIVEKSALVELPKRPWHDVLTLPYEEQFVALLNHGGLKSLLREPDLHLSTIHHAKGQEAENVYLMTDMGRKTYDHFYKEPDSEHRVFYVGVTRAKKRLFIQPPMTTMGYNNV